MINKKIIIFRGKFFKETYETFPRCIITELECIAYVRNHEFGWGYVFRINTWIRLLIFEKVRFWPSTLRSNSGFTDL